jgi:hypothetical protein
VTGQHTGRREMGEMAIASIVLGLPVVTFVVVIVIA